MDDVLATGIHAWLLGPDGEREEGGAELVERWRRGGDEVLWLDLVGEADRAAEALLTDVLGTSPSDLARLRDRRHPPMLEAFDDHLLILLRELDGRSDSIEFDTIPIGVLLGQRFLVTRHVEASRSADALRTALRRGAPLPEGGPGGLFLYIARRVAERYLPIVLGLEARLEQMEDEMFERPGDALLGELLVYKRQLKRLRRIASYHVTIFARLQDGQLDQVPDALSHRVGEVWSQMERVASLASLYNELANDLMNGYLSLATHRLNNVMKVLTVVTVIFVPLTFIAGVYGMNFEYMPELRVRGAYFVVLGLMALLAGTLLWLFRRRGWL